MHSVTWHPKYEHLFYFLMFKSNDLQWTNRFGGFRCWFSISFRVPWVLFKTSWFWGKCVGGLAKAINLVHIRHDLVESGHALLNHAYRSQQEYERYSWTCACLFYCEIVVIQTVCILSKDFLCCHFSSLLTTKVYSRLRSCWHWTPLLDLDFENLSLSF
jgi:hypothetical protein